MNLTRFIMVLLLLGWCASCTHTMSPTEQQNREDRRHTIAVDSLLQRAPDSALALLGQLYENIDSYHSPEKEYVGLMLSEATFKLRREVAYCDEVVAAMNYFDSVSLVYPKDADMAFLSARSHYMNAICLNNGIIFDDDSTTMLACQQYYEVLAIMRDHFSSNELVGHKASFLALVYARLANIYSDKFLINPTTFFYKKVLFYKQQSNASPSSLSNTLFFLGYEYEKAEEYDMALYYYDQSLAHIADTTGILYRNVINRKALASYQIDHDAEASIVALKRIAAAGKEFERNDRYLGIGYLYMLEKQYDSALVYLNTVFEEAPNMFLRTQSAEHLSEIYDLLGETQQSSEFARFVTQNTPPEFGTKADELRYTNMFDNYLNQDHEKAMEPARLANRAKMMKMVSIFLVVLFVLLIWLLVYRRRHKRSEAEKVALSGQLHEREEALSAIKKRVESASFTDEPICRHILDVVSEQQFKSKVDYLVYKDFALGKSELLALHEAADRHFGQFTKRLRDAYPAMTKGDIDYCCLYLLGLEEADIAALMQRAYNTVCDRSRKLKTIFGGDAPLATTVRNFANGG